MNDEYTTSDFPTACVLLTNKHRLVHVDRSDSRRVVFHFEETDQLIQDVEQLRIGALKVEPMEFWHAQRRCKQMIYGD